MAQGAAGSTENLPAALESVYGWVEDTALKALTFNRKLLFNQRPFYLSRYIKDEFNCTKIWRHLGRHC